MTQRAESLSEQVKKSKKRATELQAAREEAARFQSDLEECRTRLSELAAAVPTSAEAGHRRLHDEQYEEGNLWKPGSLEAPEVHKVLPRTVQLARAWHLAEERSACPAPFAELLPQQHGPKPHQPTLLQQELNGGVSLDVYEALQQELKEQRLAAELQREQLKNEQYTELDELLRSHDLERERLHREVNRVTGQIQGEQANATVTQFILDIREHLQSQVAAMKEEFGAQLADVDELQRERHALEANSRLESCHAELTTAQEEFMTLAVEFEKERREHLSVQQRLRELEARQEPPVEVAPGFHEAGEHGIPTPLPRGLHALFALAPPFAREQSPGVDFFDGPTSVPTCDDQAMYHANSYMSAATSPAVTPPAVASIGAASGPGAPQTVHAHGPVSAYPYQPVERAG